jgi:hypothetical protein
LPSVRAEEVKRAVALETVVHAGSATEIGEACATAQGNVGAEVKPLAGLRGCPLSRRERVRVRAARCWLPDATAIALTPCPSPKRRGEILGWPLKLKGSRAASDVPGLLEKLHLEAALDGCYGGSHSGQAAADDG